ncbi:TPA: hypothetical protein OEL94_001290 [Klebsiella pneumoniae]|uniref:hypothetical protein n=1 Tax=Klebsiella pneumoniae TaxID=573 RepID=UPI002719A7F9|nr:hypothetical protein [Klebsiella pneumoniae]MDP0387084.1 hypothetical protein [Klebsiella pneumoniae]MDP0446480.1 hypothetical protein [Klebsiella pneumoniae]HCP5845680.1 hypothetical protein [Klebsiella pneumoniae]HCP6153427.1 hypothetical protein [Klebsiella pneumoniae]
MTTTVYAVLLDSGYDTEELQDIFSTEELAQDYISNWLTPSRLRVVPYVVDAGCDTFSREDEQA